MTKYLNKEENYLPWQRAITALTYVVSMFEDDEEVYPLMQVMLNAVVYYDRMFTQ